MEGACRSLFEEVEKVLALGREAVVERVDVGGGGGFLGGVEAEVGGETELEAVEEFFAGVVGDEVIESEGEEVVEDGDGGFFLGGEFDELDEVRGGEGAAVAFADGGAVVGDVDLAEVVEVAVGFAGAGEDDFGLVEEIEAAGEGAGGAEGSAGDGLDEAVLWGAP